MGIGESGIIEVEGLGDTQGQCGLHRIITQVTTHNPVREDRAKNRNNINSINHDHVTTNAANGPQRRRSLSEKEMEK